MGAISSTLASLGIGAVVATASAASAFQQVPFVGRFTANRGQLMNRPIAGNAPCGSLTIMSGPGHTMKTWWITPPARTMTAPAAPFGCVAGKGVVTTTGMGAGVGAGFKIAPYGFSKPLPAYPAAVSGMSPMIAQFATSFRVTGPRPAFARPPAGTMNNGMNTAAFHVFKPGAWMTQTGRAGSMFSWCPGFASHCMRASLGLHGAVVKYTGGGNAFGGTMALVATAGANGSSIALHTAGTPALRIAQVKPVLSEPTGRGYADYAFEVWDKPKVWSKHKEKTVTRPLVGKQKLVTMVTGYLGHAGQAGHEYRWGFPWTTRTVLVRETTSHFGNPYVLTLTARGHDTITPMGVRNISLVAGGVAAGFLGLEDFETVTIAQMTLPEPTQVAQLAAGVLGLLAIAVLRARTRS